MRGGLGIWHLNTDYFKRWLHERFERDPLLPGGWHLAEDTTEEFCKSMVSEARVLKASGRVTWVLLNKNNHYFDCEVNNLAAAYSLNLQMMTSEAAEVEKKKVAERRKQEDTTEVVTGRSDPFRSKDTGGRKPGGWFDSTR
jgi:phage terminase large subunit GpA-like protein